MRESEKLSFDCSEIDVYCEKIEKIRESGNFSDNRSNWHVVSRGAGSGIALLLRQQRFERLLGESSAGAFALCWTVLHEGFSGELVEQS